MLESDDWGSIRMPSKEVYDSLVSEGFDFSADDGYRFNKYDTFATSQDISMLFETLSSVRDSANNPAVMTPVAVVANPDFKKIEESGFTEYFYEPFTETLKKTKNCENSFKLWKEGISRRLFVPQFHGREHLNVKVWMMALSAGHEKTLKAFSRGFWGLSTANDPEVGVEFQAAFDYFDKADINYHKEIIASGVSLFHDIFGYKPQYFVPPNGPFSNELEPVCGSSGIKFISVPKLRMEPLGSKKWEKHYHYFGQKSRSGIRYITRNCLFEPSQPGTDWVDSCLYEISCAFRWRKPAIISSHRVNYVGALSEQNRDNGLNTLKMLLKNIMKNWPDAEFVTTAELGEVI
ncbi:MAG: hypothetical protein JXB00_08670 [Bacteroidales bacterium]|nr:hypothetical protein [Bacteroidales bacterium]